MSWLYLAELEEAYSRESCSDGERYAQSRMTATASKCCSSGSETASSRSSPSGTTCEPSAGMSGAVESMSLPPGFLASLSAEHITSAAANTTHGTSGRRQSGSFAKYDHASRSWRTAQISLLTHTPCEFSGTWPKSGIVCAGTAWRLPPLEQFIADNGCGLLPTPTARDCKGTSSASWRENNATPDTLPDKLAEMAGSPNSVAVVPQPRFVESVMLWPDMWTDCAHSAMDGFRLWERKHGR